MEVPMEEVPMEEVPMKEVDGWMESAESHMSTRE